MLSSCSGSSSERVAVRDEWGDERAWVVTGDPEMCKSGLCAAAAGGSSGMGGKRCCDVKLTSPFFKLDEEETLCEVRCVVDAFKSEFDVLLDDKSSGGLHVRVRKERGAWELQTVKNFCVFVMDFEPWLSLPERIVTNGRIERWTGGVENMSAFQSAVEIQRCKSLEEVVRLFPLVGGIVDANFAYNLSSLADDGFIEFRRREGTLEMSEIIRWVELMCGMVKYAEEVFLEDLAQLVQDVGFDGRKDGVELLARLRLGGLARCCRSCKRYDHPRVSGDWTEGTLRKRKAKNLKPVDFVSRSGSMMQCK